MDLESLLNKVSADYERDEYYLLPNNDILPLSMSNYLIFFEKNSKLKILSRILKIAVLSRKPTFIISKKTFESTSIEMGAKTFSYSTWKEAIVFAREKGWLTVDVESAKYHKRGMIMSLSGTFLEIFSFINKEFNVISYKNQVINTLLGKEVDVIPNKEPEVVPERTWKSHYQVAKEDSLAIDVTFKNNASNYHAERTAKIFPGLDSKSLCKMRLLDLGNKVSITMSTSYGKDFSFGTPPYSHDFSKFSKTMEAILGIPSFATYDIIKDFAQKRGKLTSVSSL